MKNLNYLMVHILYQIPKIILNIYKKKYGEKTVNPSIRIYINKIENRVTFKIKTGYYLELLTPETMKLLGSTENSNGTNVYYLEITKVVLTHCNVVNQGRIQRF